MSDRVNAPDPAPRAPRAPSPRTVRLAKDIAAFAARNAWPAGRHVTELELAGALAVSRTPIRGALQLLHQAGAMEARPGRGFVLRCDGASLTALPLGAPATLDETLRTQLLRDRIAGALPLSVTPSMIAARYGAGRAVLERVLHTLAAEGLVTRDAGHGWRFLPSLEGTSGVRASYELRLLVEPPALLLPGVTLDPDEIARQQQRHAEIAARLAGPHTGQPAAADLFDLDAAFHETLAGFSRNDWITGLVRQQNALRRLLEFDSYQDPARVLGWVREHQSVLKALQSGSTALASRRLHAHLARALRIATRRIG